MAFESHYIEMDEIITQFHIFKIKTTKRHTNASQSWHPQLRTIFSRTTNMCSRHACRKSL